MDGVNVGSMEYRGHSMEYRGHSMEVLALNLSDIWIILWSLNCFVNVKKWPQATDEMLNSGSDV
jgi:hypothetical protein